MQEAQTLCKSEEAQSLQVKEENEATQAAALSEESSDTEEKELEDFEPELEEWDRFDITVNEFVNLRKSNSFPLKNYKLVLQKEHRSMPKCSLRAPSKDISESLSALSKAEKQEQTIVQTRRNYHRYKKREHVVIDFPLDLYAEVILSKFIKSKFIKQVNGVIRVGKEAAVLHAETYGSYKRKQLPRECVMKVYKLDVPDCSARDKYLLSDPRVRRYVVKPINKKLAHLFVEKEKLNLTKLKNAGIHCPDFVAKKGHVLVMTFIGDNYKPALKLKYAKLSEEDYLSAYNQVIDAMKNLYTKVDLIHTDLSEYNILWHNTKCYIIDFSQAVEPCTLDAYQFLMEDCVRILNFFKRNGVENVLSPEELFKNITGCELGDRMRLTLVIEKFNENRHPEFAVLDG